MTWSEDCAVIKTNLANQVLTFELIETNLYVLVATLSTQDNVKLLSQLKPSFKRTISWEKCLLMPESLPRNANLNHLVELNFQRVNRLFILLFENDA